MALLSRTITSAALPVGWLILAFTLVRLALAFLMPPVVDETYAIAVSRELSLSWYDHPPLMFVIAHYAAMVFGADNIALIRLPFVAMGTLSAFLMHAVTRRAFGADAAWWAVAWFCVAPFFMVSAGHFVVPDGPLNLFLLASVWCVLPLVLEDRTEGGLLRWLGAGIFLALAFLSKYHAALFVLSALLFLLLTRVGRNQLRTPGPWIAGLIALAGLAPSVIWNMENGWASFGFQTARAATGESGFEVLNLAKVLGGQMLYILPGAWLAAIALIARALLRPADTARFFFGILALLPVVIFIAIAAISKDNFPHWAMPGFLFAFPLIGQWCDETSLRMQRLNEALFRLSALAIPLIVLLAAAQFQHAIFTRPFFDQAPNGDGGWEIVPSKALATEWQNLPDNGAVLVTDWIQGGKAGFALGADVRVIALSDPKHFAYAEDVTQGDPKWMVHACALDTQASCRDLLTRLFQEGGYQTAGEPRIIIEPSADYPRYVYIVLPLTRAQ